MNKLTEFEQYVIEHKGTERPFSGEFYLHSEEGVYHCKRCDAALYRSEHKFHAHCGWPAFDDEIAGAVKRLPYADGQRTEILCQQCGAHLGHLFAGEYLTEKNIRHCVNSVSLSFKPVVVDIEDKVELATFAGGCFWCLEAVFSQLNGVISVTSGYSGGDAEDANYEAVCTGETYHAEVVQITFDPNRIDYQTLLMVFFSSHDPTTLNRQGHDIGTQYRSVIFAHNAEQIDKASEVIKQLSGQFNAPIVTELVAFEQFYPAEQYHENYFSNHIEHPYCQLVIKPKLDKFLQRFKDKLKID